MQENQATILIVDDEPLNIDVLRGALHNYKIKVATHGEMALKIAFLPQTPDLILLDVKMPGMDGHEVCRRLKDDPRTVNVPVIFVTAMKDIDDEVKGLQMGAVDYLIKPVKAEIVLARVQTYLKLYQQSKMLEQILNQCTSELTALRELLAQRSTQ